MPTHSTEDPADFVEAETTDLLRLWQDGDLDAAEAVLRRCYDELRALARHRLQGERPDHTLEATDLVHEAFLRRLEDRTPSRNRAHFVGRAGLTMRTLLVDHARARQAAKRGGSDARVPLDDARHIPSDRAGGPAKTGCLDLLDLENALQELEALDPSKVRLVELRFFLGLDITETAEALGMSRATAGRRWRLTRAWLRQRLGPAGRRFLSQRAAM